MVNAQQQQLWHDTAEDALRAAVERMGGPKRVASRLWPARTITDAARLLNHCLDPERPEKLALGEVVLLLQWAREAGCHVGMQYLAETCGYEPPAPKDPETEAAKLQREFCDAVDRLGALQDRMAAAGLLRGERSGL